MKMTLLKVTLWVTGGLFCLAGPWLFMPAAWWQAMAGWFLDAETMEQFWPFAPAFDYVMRAMMAMSLWLGVILIVAARNPEKHRTQIDIAIGGLLLLAVVFPVAGAANGLPVWWYLGDTIFSAIAGVALLILRPNRA